jgi:hypothetical protein
MLTAECPEGPLFHPNRNYSISENGCKNAFARLWPMPAAKRKTKPIQAKRTADRLRWVIARIPIDVAKIWGKRGQIKVQGEINGFAFTTTLFPDGQGHHFFIVNKKMLSGGKTAAGLTAKFRLQPDTTPRITVSPPAELLRELGQSKRLLKFFESLSPSRRHEIAKWVAQCKTSDARKRRSLQIAERLMESRARAASHHAVGFSPESSRS